MNVGNLIGLFKCEIGSEMLVVILRAKNKGGQPLY